MRAQMIFSKFAFLSFFSCFDELTTVGILFIFETAKVMVNKQKKRFDLHRQSESLDLATLDNEVKVVMCF